jgi:alkylation response protein AidB-like acyl-CoA dehydrogenase
MSAAADDPLRRARDLQPLVRTHADEAERDRRLPGVVAGGSRATGQWQFVSGCHNSSVFGGLVLLDESGAPNPGAVPAYAMVEAAHFEIVDTWHVGGLRGSGSHDVRLNGVLVPDERIVAPIGPRGATPLFCASGSDRGWAPHRRVRSICLAADRLPGGYV